MTAGILASNQLSFKMNLCGTFKRSVRYTFMAELKYIEAGMLSVCLSASIIHSPQGTVLNIVMRIQKWRSFMEIEPRNHPLALF